MSIKEDVVIGEGTKIWYPELSNLYGCRIGKNCNIGSHVMIAKAVVGDDCKIQSFVFIPEGVKIGNKVFVCQSVTFCNDKYPEVFKVDGTTFDLLKIIVEDGVSIGAGSVILPGIRIGKNALIGAGSVVTKNVPDDEVWVGNPAEFLKGI